MIQDGIGYGRSLYWEWKAQWIAKEEDEACKHLEDNLPKIEYKYRSNYQGYNFKFKVRCHECNRKFPNTEKIITQKFLDFYGMGMDQMFNDL